MILLTGASGFIGNRLLNLLDTSKSKIRLLSRIPDINFETFTCDFEHENIPESALESVDTVFHLAGFAHDNRDAYQIKNLYQKINVDTTVQLAKIAIKKGVKRFIFVSSVKAGGRSISGHFASEEDQTEPEDIYGKTKREAEFKLLEIAKNSNMHVSIVRPALVYGPAVKGNLSLMLSGIKKGWFPPLPKINNCRSMIHVDDLVRALLLVSRDDRTNGEIYIATDGLAYTSREIYEAMCGILNKSIPQWGMPSLLFDILALLSPRMRYKVNKLIGDECYSSKKLQLLGFKAQLSIREMNETSF
jgi:UDP-glucose 4-epimerase